MEAVKARKPSLREQQKASSRERFLDAAVVVFKEVGFRNATVDQIVNEAGASRATFYLHFKDKTSLAAGLARRLTPRAKEQFEALSRMNSPSVQALEKWVAAYQLTSQSQTVEGKMLLEALASDSAFIHEYHVYLEFLADHVMKEALAKVPSKRRGVVRSKFIMICLTMDRYVTINVDSDRKFPAANAERAIAEMLKREFFDEQEELAS